jgi:YHS domain-containing protein
MRAAALLLWVLLAVALVWPLLRRRHLPSPADPPTPLDELVKDPVCQTYVVRSRAIRRAARGGPRYFCSSACAKRYLPS